MRMNTLMHQLLHKAKLDLDRALDEAAPEQSPELVMVGNSVLLADHYKGSQHVFGNEFADRTGYEAFINHYHVRCGGSPAELRKLIAEIASLRASLARYAPGKSFLILISISEGECTIRFHERRRGESWLADDLEGYTQDAVAAIDVGAAVDC